MPKKNLLNVSHDMVSISMTDLLTLLGSPKKTQQALVDLEKASKKADKARKALEKAESEQVARMDAEERKRENDIKAIHKDKEALANAWAELEKTTANQNAGVQDARKALRRDQAEFKEIQKAHAMQAEHLENSRDLLQREQEKVNGQVAEARREAIADRKAAEAAKEEAKKFNKEANRKIADMRKLVA